MNSLYRNEEKYICSSNQLEHLNFLLSKVMKTDSSSVSNNYHVSSLYFDTKNDRFFMETLEGIAKRKKYRIRRYNYSNSGMKFECKQTLLNKKNKQTILINEIEANKIIKGNKIRDNEMLSQFFLINKIEKLSPKIIIDYDRTAFIYPELNIRITLDRSITVSDKIDTFFKKITNSKYILENRAGILEIKYDTDFPSYIRALLKLENLEQSSFSKYAMGRLTINPQLSHLR